MSNILYNEIPNATDFAKSLKPAVDRAKLPYINASEVIAEFDKRCGNGMQYTTFPNSMTDLEVQKLTSKGFIVTFNVVPSSQRHGAGDLYIGFQVALNSVAAKKSMQIVPDTQIEEIGDTLDSVDVTMKSIEGVLSQTKTSIDQGNTKIDNVGAKVAEVNASVGTLKQSLDESNEQIKQDVAAIKQDVGTTSADVAIIKESVTSKSEEVN